MTDTYVLTIWASQTLLDEATYHVTANSKKEAAALLMQLHNQASERGIAIECPEVTCAWRVPEQQHQVWRLELRRDRARIGGREGRGRESC